MTKLMQVSKDILPIEEFKAQAPRVLRRLKRARGSIVLTQNGKPAAVLVAPKEFDRLREQAGFADAVREGLDDSNAGRLIDDEALGSELDAEFGPIDDR